MDDRECSICFEPMNDDGAPAYGGIFCDHAGCFHHSCIASWLSKNQTCPLCRCDAEDPHITNIIVRFEEAVRWNDMMAGGSIMEELNQGLNKHHGGYQGPYDRLVKTIWEQGRGFIEINMLLYTLIKLLPQTETMQFIVTTSIPHELGLLFLEQGYPRTEIYMHLAILMKHLVHIPQSGIIQMYDKMGVVSRWAAVLSDPKMCDEALVVPSIMSKAVDIIVYSICANGGISIPAEQLLKTAVRLFKRSGCPFLCQSSWRLLNYTIREANNGVLTDELLQVVMIQICRRTQYCKDAIPVLTKIIQMGGLQELLPVLPANGKDLVPLMIIHLAVDSHCHQEAIECLTELAKSGAVEMDPLSEYVEYLCRLARVYLYNTQYVDLLAAILQQHPAIVSQHCKDDIKDLIQVIVSYSNEYASSLYHRLHYFIIDVRACCICADCRSGFKNKRRWSTAVSKTPKRYSSSKKGLFK